VVPLERLRRSPRAPLTWFAGGRAIAQLAREIDAVLLVANTIRAACYGALAARLARVPFVWHMRDFWLSESRPRHAWADTLGKELLCAAAIRVLVNSYATASHLPCQNKAVVVHNGIEVERFDPSLDSAAFRSEHGIPRDVQLVGTVGRLRPWKGQDRFLRAMVHVATTFPEARFVSVGGEIFGVKSDYPERLRRLASDLGLADRFSFTGHLADIRPAMAALDIFVHPGDPEPFGLVNLEAMAMSKPIVAFAHGALPEIVIHGETGLLVPPNDEVALAEAVKSLLDNPAQGRAMGQAGRKRVSEQFTARRMAVEVSETLREILE
jgi:glycosyltransferase involved in cell wall biosynthesis